MNAMKSLSRSELYTLVWQEPMSQLFKKFAISDVGLAKICRKHNIPCPSRGYWVKKQNGQEAFCTPLPKSNHDEPIELRDNSNGQYSSAPLNKDVSGLIDAERIAENKIVVDDTLRGAHPLVSQANQQLQRVDTDRDGIFKLPERVCLRVSVSKSALRRALLIIDAILKAVIQRGYEVRPGPSIIIMGEAIGFYIEEKVETKQESANENDLEGPYVFRRNRFNEKRTPTGHLSLHITNEGKYSLEGCRHQWNDTVKHPLEKRLNQIVAGLIEMASRVKLRKEEDRKKEELKQKEDARSHEEDRQRAERRKQYKSEKAKVDHLLTQLEHWKQSKHLRELIEAVKLAHSAKGPIPPDSEISRWIIWATQQADRLDPLIVSPPSILDDKSLDDSSPTSSAFRHW